MSRNVTLSQLRTDIAAQCDFTTSSSGRYPPTLLNRLINQSIQRFRERISNEGITHFLVSSSGTLPAGRTSPYSFQSLDLSALNPSLVRTYGIDITIAGVVRSLEHRPFTERNEFIDGPDMVGQPIAWAHFQSASVAIMPAPDTAYPYTLWYLPLLADLSADGDTFDGVAGWEIYILWDCVCQLIARDQYQAAYAQAVLERDKAWEDIIRSATKVSSAGGAFLGRDTLGKVGLWGRGRMREVAGTATSGLPPLQSISNAMLNQRIGPVVIGRLPTTLGATVDVSVYDLITYISGSVYDVHAYGAVGDGITDDTAAIQAAIDACVAARGGIVRFRALTYLISALNVTGSAGVTLEGQGDIGNVNTTTSGTVLLKSGTTGYAVTFTSCQSSGPKNIVVQQKRDGSTPTAGGAFHIHSCVFPFHENIRASETYNGLLLENVLEHRGQGYAQFRDLFGDACVQMLGPAGAGYFERLSSDVHKQSEDTLPGQTRGARQAATFYTVGSTYYTTGGLFFQCTVAGTTSAGTGPTTVPGSTVADARSTDVTDGTATFRFVRRMLKGIDMHDGGGWTVMSAAMLNCDVGIEQSGGNWLFIQHSEIDHAYTHAINLTGGTGFKAVHFWGGSTVDNGVEVAATYSGPASLVSSRVSGCLGASCVAIRGGPERVSLVDVEIDDCAAYGIVLTGAATHVKLIGNDIRNCDLGAILINDPSADYLYIWDNDYSIGNGAGITNNSTGTHNKIQDISPIIAERYSTLGTVASTGDFRLGDGDTMYYRNSSGDRRVIEVSGESQSFGALVGSGFRFWDVGDSGQHIWRDGNGGARNLAKLDKTSGFDLLGNNLAQIGALGHIGSGLGFYGATKIPKQTGVPVTVTGIHQALAALGLIS